MTRFCLAFVLIAAICMAQSCTPDQPPLAPRGGKPSPLHRSSPTFIECATKQCIETVLDTFRNGDTLYIASGTYEWDVDEEGEFLIDSTLTIIGEDTTAVLEKSAGSSSDVFFTASGGNGIYNCTFENVKLIVSSSAVAFNVVNFNLFRLSGAVVAGDLPPKNWTTL